MSIGHEHVDCVPVPERGMTEDKSGKWVISAAAKAIIVRGFYVAPLISLEKSNATCAGMQKSWVFRFIDLHIHSPFFVIDAGFRSVYGHIAICLHPDLMLASSPISAYFGLFIQSLRSPSIIPL